MAKKVLAELTDVYGDKFVQKEGESGTNFIHRIIKWFGKQEGEEAEAKWQRLSEAAQNFVNANVESINKSEPLVDFPDDPVLTDLDAGDGKKGKKAAKDAPKGKGDKKAAKEKPAKASKPDKDKSKPSKKGVIRAFRRIVARHPKWSTEQCIEEGIKQGLKAAPGTAKRAYYTTRDTLTVLQDMKMLSEDYFVKKADKETTKEPAKEKSASKDTGDKPKKKKKKSKE